MTKTTFSAQQRRIQGSKVGQLRREMMVPGNVYGAGKKSLMLQFPATDFEKLYQQVGETGLVYLQIAGDKKEKPTLVSEVQRDPVNNQLLHASFKEVSLTEKIEAEVPIEMTGEFDVKEAVLVQVRNEAGVEALPTDLPEKFVVNVAELKEIGQMITLADLDFDKTKVSLVEVETAEDWQKPVVLVQEQREEEVEEQPEVSPEDVEIEGEVEVEAGAEDGEKSDKEKSSAEETVEKEAEKTDSKSKAE